MNTTYLKNPLVIAAVGGIALSIIMYMKNRSSDNNDFSVSYFVKVFAVGAFASGGLSYGATFLKDSKVLKGGGNSAGMNGGSVAEVNAALPSF